VMQNSFFVGVYPGLDDVQIDYVLEIFERFFEGRIARSEGRVAGCR